VAVIGANRPRLYWTFAAVQSLGGVPVPVYADAVAEEMAYVLDHAGVRFAVVQDQEQVDKVRSYGEKMPSLEQVIYDEPRGMRDYDHTGLHSFVDVQQAGRAALEAIPASPRAGKRRSRPAAATTSPSSSTPPARPAAPRA
jgi:long-chain acyl-CoA synthetase